MVAARSVGRSAEAGERRTKREVYPTAASEGGDSTMTCKGTIVQKDKTTVLKLKQH